MQNQVAVVAIAALFFLGGNSSSSVHRYAIVFDAGSTGSRIHVFKFTAQHGTLDLESDTFEQLKPGLSSYADNPTAASASLEPLMKVALSTVPASLQVGAYVDALATLLADDGAVASVFLVVHVVARCIEELRPAGPNLM